MMRDRHTADKARYIYFGADENGELVLQNRTRNSFHHWWNETASPYDAKSQGYTAAEYPYVKLIRDHDSQTVYAFVSKDGELDLYYENFHIVDLCILHGRYRFRFSPVQRRNGYGNAARPSHTVPCKARIRSRSIGTSRSRLLGLTCIARPMTRRA